MMIESLEKRELMSAGVPLVEQGLPGAQPNGFSLNFGEVRLQFTPPLGSDKGSFAQAATVIDGTSNTIMFRAADGRATFPSSFQSVTKPHADGVMLCAIGGESSSLPYIEQDNLYKCAEGAADSPSLMEEEGIGYF